MKTKEEILKVFTLEEGAWWSYKEGIQEGFSMAFNDLRKRAAIAAMQAMVSDYQTIQRLVDILRERGDEEALGLEKVVAERSVAFSDALIEELKKE